jgi:hypothetical protein
MVNFLLVKSNQNSRLWMNQSCGNFCYCFEQRGRGRSVPPRLTVCLYTSVNRGRSVPLMRTVRCCTIFLNSTLMAKDCLFGTYICEMIPMHDF